MREIWSAARVGLMVVFGFIVIVVVYRYVDERSSLGTEYQVHAYFSNVQGLVSKSRVLIAGIPVGHIDKIQLEGNLARVELSVDQGIKLYTDAMVAMRSVSFLGERVLLISPGTPSLPEIANGGEIKTTEEGVQTDDLLASANDIAQSVRRITKQFERAFGTEEAGDRMERVLQHLSNALANIDAVTEQAAPKIQSILDHVDSATGNLAKIIDTRKSDIDHGIAEVNDTISSIHRAADQLNAVLEDVKEVTARTAAGEGTLGRLTQDETLIDEVEGAAQGINGFVGGLTRLRTLVELRSEYNVLANSLKTYFSLYLQPRESRYFLFQVVDDPRDTVNVTDTIVRQSPPPLFEPEEFRRTEITRSNPLRFSAEFGKTIQFATFRFGVIESTGGLGVDLSLLNDRLEVNTDVFSFGAQTLPRARVRASYEILRRFRFLAGVDDMLNNAGRDYFFGLQLRFDDEDLKPLIPITAVAL